jgi:hypothetical protein
MQAINRRIKRTPNPDSDGLLFAFNRSLDNGQYTASRQTDRLTTVDVLA